MIKLVYRLLDIGQWCHAVKFRQGSLNPFMTIWLGVV